MAKMRVTYHNGRTNKFGVYSPKHNDRNFDVTQAEHITEDKANQNIYWHCFQDDNPTMDFAQAEMQYYKAHFEDYLAVRNAKSIKQGHADRIQTIEDYHKSRKSCPEETIYQVGDVTKSISKAQLAEIFAQYNQWQKEHYPQVVTLNWAYHADEQGAGHIQERHVWIAHDKEGRAMVNQGEALKEMGVERPEPDKKEGRYNNAKMTYTQMARQKLVDLCRSHGIEIEDKPKEPSKTGKDLIKWQAEQDRQKSEEAVAVMQNAKADQKEMLAEIARAEVYLAEVNAKTEKEKARAEEAEKLNKELEKNLEQLKKDTAEAELRNAEILGELENLKSLADAENTRLENLRLADEARQRAENEQIQRLAELKINVENLTEQADKEKARANKNKKRADNAENKALEMEELTKNLTTLEMIKRDKIEQLEKEYDVKKTELQVKENEQLQHLKDLELKEQLIKNRVAGLLEDNVNLSTENKRLNKEYEENFNLTTKSILKIKEAAEAEQKYNILYQEISSTEKELNRLNIEKEQAIKIIAPIKNEIVPALLAVDTAIRYKRNLETPVMRLWGATKSIVNALPDYFNYDQDDKNANATLHKLGDAELAETDDKTERAYKEMWRDM